MKLHISIIILVFAFFLSVHISEVSAYTANRPNNIFGIHLATASEQEMQQAADLVNGTSGSWGYVTMVIQENDRDRDKWQNILDKAAQYQLIPLIRIATQPEGSNWRKPEAHESGEWVSFFEELNWHMKYKYIILFNETNHATEWGGTVNPEEYAQVAYAFAKDLKDWDADAFIMLAGFDASAPTQSGYEDQETYLRRMFDEIEPALWEDVIDGWASHSYPRGFTGSTTDTGRKSLRTYDWELDLLSSFGFQKQFPVFITETGWHNTVDDIVEKYRIAYQTIWIPDDRVVAVTPFILSYETPPFDVFSWKKPGKDTFYDHYAVVQGMVHVYGEPLVEADFPYVFPDVPETYTFFSPIRDLSEDAIVSGYDDQYFRPERSVSRGEMAKFIQRAFSLEQDTSCPPFSDVPETYSFYDSVTSLKCVGIVSGFADGTYQPEKSVTRGEAMKFVMKALRNYKQDADYLAYSGSAEPFSDVPVDSTFYEVIMAAHAHTVVSGYEDGTFQPDTYTLRGAMSKMVDYARDK